MNGWLIDTNVVSEMRKRVCDPQVEIWINSQPQDSLFLSVVSLAEIRFGIDRATSAARRQDLIHWLNATLRPWFNERTVGLDEETIFEWRRMIEDCRMAGQPVGEPDLLIAASAKRNELCVATRNTAEFARAGVAVFNPWQNVLERPGQKPQKINGLMMIDRLRR